MRGIVALVCFATLPFGVSAEIDFEPPHGCKPVITAQLRKCSVMNVWRCDENGSTFIWHGFFTSGGVPQSLIKFSNDYGFHHSLIFGSQQFEMAIRPVASDWSLAELVETGSVEFNGQVLMRKPGDKMVAQRFGYSELSGEKAVIDGEQLTVFESFTTRTGPNGETVGSSSGKHYISERDSVTFPGKYYDVDSSGPGYDRSPMQIIRPGEEGFFSRIPKYDCGEQTSYLYQFERRTLW